MGSVSADIRIQFVEPKGIDDTLELVVNDLDQYVQGSGITVKHNSSIQSQFPYASPLDLANRSSDISVYNLSARSGILLEGGGQSDNMFNRGKKIIRVYCSNAAAVGLIVMVDEGFNSSTKFLQVASRGRMSEKYTEMLSWSGEKEKRLKYPYDTPNPVVVRCTEFYTESLQRVAAPSYNPITGMFTANVPVIGSMWVVYEVHFSVYLIDYNLGLELYDARIKNTVESLFTLNKFPSYNAKVSPPVRVIALSGLKIADATFERKFEFKTNQTPLKAATDVDLKEVAGARETCEQRVPITRVDDDEEECFVFKNPTSIQMKNADGGLFRMQFMNGESQ